MEKLRGTTALMALKKSPCRTLYRWACAHKSIHDPDQRTPRSLLLSSKGRQETGGQRHNLSCQAPRLMSDQMQPNCHARALRTRVGAQRGSVRTFYHIGQIERH